MTTPVYPDNGRAVQINGARLWVGGVATAIIAALVVLVGVSIAKGVLGVAVPVPTVTGGMSELTYVLLAAGATLLATGLLHLLLLGAPRPLAFFGWIAFLAVLLAVIAPFSNAILGTAAGSYLLSSKVSTAIINLVAGVAIISLLTGTAHSAITRRRQNPYGPADPYSADPYAPADPYRPPARDPWQT